MTFNYIEKPKSLYKYYLLDSHYKSDSLNKGRKFKNFFDKLCQHIFDINLTMLEDIEEFPLLYGETKGYSSIAAAINAITPYHISECYCRVDEADKNKKWRNVDFWCQYGDLPIWIESKSIKFCVSEKAKGEITKKNKNLIQDAYKQIFGIHEVEPETHKLVLLNTRVYCTTEDFKRLYSPKYLDEVPQNFVKKLEKLKKEYEVSITKQNKDIFEGILLGILDLREYIQKNMDKDIKDILHRIDYYYGYEDYEKYVAPYIILAGLVITQKSN